MAENLNGKISEKDLWRWLNLASTASEIDLKNLHMERIENLVGAGNADVSGCYMRDYFDIELKTAERPARATKAVLRSADDYVRASQKVWHTLRWAAGGNNFFLIQVGRLKGARRYLIPGCEARRIEDRTEADFQDMCVVDPRRSPLDFVRVAAAYRSANLL